MGVKKGVRKDFESFARKVEEMESLKRRLKGLNIKGFKGEANVIKSKLKDLNSISQVRKGVRELENKIKLRDEGVRDSRKALDKERENFGERLKDFFGRNASKKSDEIKKLKKARERVSFEGKKLKSKLNKELKKNEREDEIRKKEEDRKERIKEEKEEKAEKIKNELRRREEDKKRRKEENRKDKE
jgi:hypothetical protein